MNVLKINVGSRYPFEALLHACCSLTDEAYMTLDKDSKNDGMVVFLEAKRATGKKKILDLRRKLMSALEHYALAHEIEKNNKKIKEYIIGRALFSAIPFSEVEEDELDYKKDPLGIAQVFKNTDKKIRK